MSERLRVKEDDTNWFEKMGAFVIGVIGIIKNALLGINSDTRKK